MQPPQARATVPSSTEGDRFIVIKVLPELRLTSQFRRLLLLARREGKRVELRTPSNCVLSTELSQFLLKHEQEFELVRIDSISQNEGQ